MKRVLLKPQREAANSVLAYQDEDEDNHSFDFEVYFDSHHYCHDDNGTCQRKFNAGNCRQWGTIEVVDGVESYVSTSCE